MVVADGEDWLNFDVLRSLVGVGDIPDESPKADGDAKEPSNEPTGQEPGLQPAAYERPPSSTETSSSLHNIPENSTEEALPKVSFGQEASISIEGISPATDYETPGVADDDDVQTEPSTSPHPDESSKKSTPNDTNSSTYTEELAVESIHANGDHAPKRSIETISPFSTRDPILSKVDENTAIETLEAGAPQRTAELRQPARHQVDYQQQSENAPSTRRENGSVAPYQIENKANSNEQHIAGAADPPPASSKPHSVADSTHDELALKKMNSKDLRLLVTSLQEMLQAREAQLERQAQEGAAAALAAASLAQKNEELVLSSAAVSEKDVEDMRAEFESRLAASERKAANLLKERDELRKSNKSNNVEALLRQKDDEIRQIMEEGEILSKKQLSQETTIKQLRGKLKELKDEVATMNGRLEAEQQRSATVLKEKEGLSMELSALQDRNVELLSSERQHFERRLGEARTAAAVAEKKAEEAIKAGAARKLRDAEARVEALEATVEQLRDELERKRAAADDREDMLSSEVADLQRLYAESEARQQELQTKLPEATAALLQQIEAMQSAADAASTMSAETERSLQQQIAAAEGAAAEAREAAAAASSAIADAEERAAAAEEMLKASKEALRRAETVAADEKSARLSAENVVSKLRSDVVSAQDSLSTLEKVYAQQMDALQLKEAEAARAASALREELRSRQAQTAAAAVASAQADFTIFTGW